MAAHTASPRALFGVVTVLAAASVSGAAAADTLSFDPINGVFFNDNTLTVSVVVDSTFTDIRGLSFTFEIDPAIVTVDTVMTGQLFEDAPCGTFLDWANEEAPGDSIAVDIAGLGCSAVGPGEVLKLRFSGAAEGISPLACRNGTIRDSDNHEIPYTCIDGTIEYRIGVPTESASWTRIKAHFHSDSNAPRPVHSERGP